MRYTSSMLHNRIRRTIRIVSIFMLLLLLFLTLWRWREVESEKIALQQELMEQSDELYFRLEQELALLLSIFSDDVNTKSGLSSLADTQSRESFRRRCDFWAEQAVLPELFQSLILIDRDNGTAAQYRFRDRSSTSPSASLLKTLEQSLPAPREKENSYPFSLNLFLSRSNQAFLQLEKRSYSVYIILQRDSFFQDLGKAIQKSYTRGPLQDIAGWELNIEIQSLETVKKLESTHEAYAYALEQEFRSHQLEAETESIKAILPRELASNEQIQSILLFRDPVLELERLPDGTDPERERLWLLLRFDDTALSREALKRQLLPLLLTYIALFLLFLLFSILISHNRKAKQQLEEQISFIANLSHELRTPLGVIQNAGANIADGYVGKREQLERYGHLIKEESSRLSRMVESMLLFSGLLSGKAAHESFSPDELLRDLLPDVEEQCKNAGVELRLDIDDGIVFHANKAGLSSALQNLTRNALLYAKADFIRLAIRKSPDGEGIELSVRDNGIGIAKEEHKKVFQAFYRGSSSQMDRSSGSGIGLLVVQQVALAHGGEIQVESEPGKGAHFILSIPRQRNKR